ncbi:MAG: aminodeoxychorismate lyase [Porticoccaceae bacterium]|nr:aminodeoxychorismate lyase [Porticoccaceae bacterium]
MAIDPIFVNLGASDPLLASDRGLAFGQGMFETMLYSNGSVPLIDWHIRRLSIGAVRLQIPINTQELTLAVSKACTILLSQQSESCVLKLIVTAGVGGIGYENPTNCKSQIVVIKNELPISVLRQRDVGVKLWRCQHRLPRNKVLAGIKHLNRLDQVIGRNEPHPPDCSDGLMFDDHDCLIETTSANVFLYSSALGWVTPDLEFVGVTGVMRSLLIKIFFAEQNILVTEAPVSQNDLSSAEELFICNSIRGIVPVVGISEDNGVAKDYKIGKMTRSLQCALSKAFPCF